MVTAAAPEIFDVTVQKIADLGNDTRHFELSFNRGKSPEFKAGQFVSVLYPNNGKIVRRAYSIASPPSTNNHIDLCIKRVEDGLITSWFWTFRGGEQLRIHGAFGKFVLPEETNSDLVFVATGTGIAPLRSMIQDLLRKGSQRKIALIFGVRFENAIPYHEEWLALKEKHPNFDYIPTISRPSPEWKGESGYVQTKIEKFFPHPEGKRVYICGLNQMIQAVKEACLNWGYEDSQVRYERYD